MRAGLLVLVLSVAGIADPASADEHGLDIPSGVYALDPGHTYVMFSYLHQGLSYPRLRAVGVDGELALDARNLEASSVAIAIDSDSIRSNTDYFDEELASAKFFNAARFPHISFVGDALEMTGPDEGVLTGRVTIRGITKPLVLEVHINGARENPLSGRPTIGVSATGTLNRSDFGLERFIPAVSDRVSIALEAEFLLGGSETSAAAAAIAKQAAGVDAD